MNCTWCGHPATAHEHYRWGSDCGTCGHHACPRYRTPRRWWQFWRNR